MPILSNKVFLEEGGIKIDFESLIGDRTLYHRPFEHRPFEHGPFITRPFYQLGTWTYYILGNCICIDSSEPKYEKIGTGCASTEFPWTCIDQPFLPYTDWIFMLIILIIKHFAFYWVFHADMTIPKFLCFKNIKLWTFWSYLMDSILIMQKCFLFSCQIDKTTYNETFTWYAWE